MANDQPPVPNAVINPADLAAIIAKSHSAGFAAYVPQRPSAGIVAGKDFLPADYEKLATLPPAPARDETAANPAPTPKPAPLTLVETPRPEPKPARDFEAELAAAFEKGRASGLAEGRAQGQAEAEAQQQQGTMAELAQARDTFLTAAAALSGPQDQLAASLSPGIEAAILRLAAERAGIAIAENPAAFARRVEKLADRVAQGVRQVRVSLNPDDLARITAHLEGHTMDLMEFQPKPGLRHGDVIVTAQGISLSDLLATEDEAPE